MWQTLAKCDAMHVSNALQNCTHQWLGNVFATIGIPLVILAIGAATALILHVLGGQRPR